MSDLFQEREKAFEQKWAHDADLRFRVLARRNRLLGLWAAGEMGLSGDAAEAYAKGIVQAEIVKDGDEAVLKKIMQDLSAARVVRTEHLIRRKIEEFFAVARAEVIGKA